MKLACLLFVCVSLCNWSCVCVGAEAGGAPRFFMVTSHNPSRIMIVDDRGSNRWECSVTHPQDAAVLADGSLLTSETGGAKRFDAARKMLWEYKAPAGCQNPVAQPLPDGCVLVGNEGPCRLLEIDENGKARTEVQLATPFTGNHGQFRFCRKTSAGTYLVPFTHDGAVKEFDKEGKVVFEFPKMSLPVSAIRLPDKHTLIGAKGQLCEYDAEGKLAWQVTNEDLHGPEKIDIITGISRLKNGNTLAGNYTGSDDIADILEISHDKKVVWSLNLKGITHVAMVQLLNADLKPSDEVLAR